MDKHKKTDIEYELADVVVGMPQDFSVGRHQYRLYPVTLGKMFLLKRYIDELDFNQEIARLNPYMEAIRMEKENKETCCQVIAVHTAPNTYKDLFDRKAITARKNVFMKECDDEDIATLMVYALTWDKTDMLLEHVGLKKEAERRNKVMEIKGKDKNSVSFGGLSIFGRFIGQLKEMGYSDDEILYEKGYCYLRMMLADKIVSLYLTDDELNKLPNDVGGTMIDANDPQAFEKLKGRLKGVKFE